MTLTNDIIEAADSRSVIEGVSNNPIGNGMAWDFFRENYVALTDKYV